MDPSSYEIQELRTKFFQKLEEEHGSTKGYIHPADYARINNSDDWLRRFLIHHDLDMNSALNMLWETCEWRKANRVHEINEHTVNLEYLEEGSLFVRNRDRDGKSLLIFKCKKHVKGQKDLDDLKRCVIYWFERTERKDKGDQITIFFDMADTGLSNMDLEYTKYLISLCKYYYPNFLNYILVFEMPWVLNAAFKVIKAWLPAKAVQKIKFVSKATLKDYVDPDQALKCWGGNDDYVFKFIPEQTEFVNGKVDDNKKKVHFADGSPLVEMSPSNFSDTRHDDSPTTPVKLRISPSESVLFTQEGSDISGIMTLTNVSDQPLTYKIKTTSPEKFRVRPSCGILNPNAVASVNVLLQAGIQPTSIIRDKFLIMSFLLDDGTSLTADITELWKQSDMKKVEQHRLKCILGGQSSSVTLNGTTTVSQDTPADLEQKVSQILIRVNHMTETCSQMQGDIQLNQRLHIITFVLVLVIGIALLYLINKSTGQDSSSICDHQQLSGSAEL